VIQETDQLWGLVKVAEQLLTSQEGLGSMESDHDIDN
jgi:hypothetical protein